MRAVSCLTIPLILCSIFAVQAGAELNLDEVPKDFHKHIVEGQKKIEAITKPEEFTDEDFSFAQVEFKPALGKYIEVSGKAQNMSGKNFETARFTIKIYDEQQQQLASRSFYVNNFLVGQATKFNFYMPRFDYKKIKSHKIRFEEGYYF